MPVAINTTRPPSSPTIPGSGPAPGQTIQSRRGGRTRSRSPPVVGGRLSGGVDGLPSSGGDNPSSAAAAAAAAAKAFSSSGGTRSHWPDRGAPDDQGYHGYDKGYGPTNSWPADDGHGSYGPQSRGYDRGGYGGGHSSPNSGHYRIAEPPETEGFRDHRYHEERGHRYDGMRGPRHPRGSHGGHYPPDYRYDHEREHRGRSSRGGGTSLVIGGTAPIHLPKSSDPSSSERGRVRDRDRERGRDRDRERDRERPPRGSSAASVFRGRPDGEVDRRAPVHATDDSHQKILLSLRTPTSSFEEKGPDKGRKTTGLTLSPEDPPPLDSAHRNRSGEHLYERSPEGSKASIDMAPSFTLFNQSFDSFGDGHYFNVDSALQNDSFGMVRSNSAEIEPTGSGTAASQLLQKSSSGGNVSSQLLAANGSGALTIGYSPVNSFGNASAAGQARRGSSMMLVGGSDVRSSSPTQVLGMYRSYSGGAGRAPLEDSHLRMSGGGSFGAQSFNRSYAEPPSPHHYYPSHARSHDTSERSPPFYALLRKFRVAFKECTFLLPGLKAALLEAPLSDRGESGTESLAKGQKWDSVKPGHGRVGYYGDAPPQDVAIARRRVDCSVCAFGGNLNSRASPKSEEGAARTSIFREKDDPDTGALRSVHHPPAPEQINLDLVRMFPSAVHKLDEDGNLPLHMASASANAAMIKLLGDRFPSGASVRNEAGMLPLHLAILACAAPFSVQEGADFDGAGLVRMVLNYFPGALAVADNEGNLPIHLAASVLKGSIGVHVIYVLLDEAERQVQNPYGIRFRKPTKIEDIDNISVETESTVSPTDSSTNHDGALHCNMVTNEHGETPLMAAIHSDRGYEVIEALVRGPSGAESALVQDAQQNNALHLLVGDTYRNPAGALSILRLVPEAAGIKNAEGMLPIEIACIQMLPKEIILALVLVDMPIDLDEKHSVKVATGRGSSWWYLTCDCDDHYVEVVQEVVELCSYAHMRAMCLMKNEFDESLLGRATPKCKKVLQRALRFVGRYEFIGSSPVHIDSNIGLKVFDVLDFGTESEPHSDGKRVLLECYASEESFINRTAIMREFEIDFSFVEEVSAYAVGGDYWGQLNQEGVKQYVVAIQRPTLTLHGVMHGMLGNEELQLDRDVRSRYTAKVFGVLELMGKALYHLHGLGVVHGNLCAEACAKFDEEWKLADILDAQIVGEIFESSRFSASAPPEAIEALRSASGHPAAFRTDLVCSPAIDIWAFGKVAFEVLVGLPLVEFDSECDVGQDHKGLMDIMHWSDFNTEEVRSQLQLLGVPSLATDMIASCLAPDQNDRPTSADLVNHPVWEAFHA